MRIDNLFQFIVPLTFLAIWALTSLFNRESQSLPPRSARPPGPRPPGPGPRPMPRPGEPPLRWAPADSSGMSLERTPAARPMARPDDDILILDDTPRRPSPVPNPRTSPARRANRARPAPAPPAKRPEPASHRVLGTTKGALLSSSKNSLELSPLALPHSPLTTQDPHDTGRTTTPSPPPSTKAAGDTKALVITAARLRETIILNEILQPPIALRPIRRARM